MHCTNFLGQRSYYKSFFQQAVVLFQKLFWPIVRKKNVLVMEKNFCKFEVKGREIYKLLRSLEQFIQTVEVQNNFWHWFFFHIRYIATIKMPNKKSLGCRNLQEQVKMVFCYQKLFRPTVRKKWSSDWEKFLTSLEQFIQTVKVQSNFL